MSTQSPLPAAVLPVALALLALAGCETTAARAPAETASCGPAYVESGYADGLAGRPPRDAGCPAAERDAYAQGYSAGAYVSRYGQQSPLGADAATAKPIPGAQPAGGLAPRSLDPAIPTGCTSAEARAAGRVGAPQPAACPDLGAVSRAYRQGATDSRQSARVNSLEREQDRLEYQLVKPSLSAAERRLIESRIRAIERQKRALPFQ